LDANGDIPGFGGAFLFGVSAALVKDGNGNFVDIDLLRDLGLTLSESTDCGMTWASSTPNNVGGVNVSRSIFAPQEPYFAPAILPPAIGEDYIRYIDTYTNDSGSPREVVALWLGLPGITPDGAPVVVAKTSDNDTTIENSDTFVVTINNSEENPDVLTTNGSVENPTGVPLGYALRNSLDVSFLGGLLFNIEIGDEIFASAQAAPNSPMRVDSVRSLINSLPGEIDAALTNNAAFLASSAAAMPELNNILGEGLEGSVGILIYGYRFTLQPGESKSLAYFLYQGRPVGSEFEEASSSGGCGGVGEPACAEEELEKARMTMAALVANPDFRCITPAERALIINWPGFDFFLQNENNASLFFANTQTGDYQFTTCGFGGLVLSGKGKITRKGCIVTIEDVQSDRRILIKANVCNKTGTASIQILTQGRTYNLTDKTVGDRSFNCAESPNGM
jgi:hypothetical protein